MSLLTPIQLGGRAAKNRVMFGPHETNLGRDRAISDRHVAYYERRAAGGCGIVVTEEASVHVSDWPYERAPFSGDCFEGWRLVANAVHSQGALAIAALGHAGGQGSSAYSQRELWAPSRVPDVNSREVPKWMETVDIAAVVEGFAAAAALARSAGLDGVEINAGQFSLIRQFLSGLTNHRGDEWGSDRLLFARSVLRAVRETLGDDLVVGLRLSCDELAPWAGIVPDAAADIAVTLCEAVRIDYIAVVRGSIFTASATRPDMHTAPGFNIDLARQVRAAVAGRVVTSGPTAVSGPTAAVFAQGSIVDVAMAEAALASGACDGVEMTRAQIADADLVAKWATPERIRPCLLCNQTCQVRDPRNPLVTCVVDPSSGHELDEPLVIARAARPRSVAVVGGGVAGLEAARVAAMAGHTVSLFETSVSLGGMAVTASKASGRHRLALIARWLEAECRLFGVALNTLHGGTVLNADVTIDARGSVAGPLGIASTGTPVIDAAAWLSQSTALSIGADEPVVVLDGIGGPIGVSIAETLAHAGAVVHFVTIDQVAGNELARTGDLAPANVRLQQLGVTRHLRSIARAVTVEGVEIEHRFSGNRTVIPASLVIDANHRLPSPSATGATVSIGDAVAPRTILEAILEGRRAATSIADIATPTQRASVMS